MAHQNYARKSTFPSVQGNGLQAGGKRNARETALVELYIELAACVKRTKIPQIQP